MNLPKGETRQELLNRAFLYVLIIAFSVLIFLRVKSLIFDLFVAVVLAALAEPVVYRLTKKISRQSAALVAVSLILLVIGATLFSIIPIMVQEIYFLSSQMPTYFDNFINYLNSEGDGWRVKLKESLPSNVSSSIDQVWRIGVSKAGGFIVAKVILGVLASIVLSVSFLLIGLPSPIALGVAAGILSQLIPVVGTFLGGLVPFIASISLGTNAMIATVVVLLAYQIIENYFISPRVTKSTMEIHPAIAVFSTLFGAYTLGGVGAILALPVAATVQGVIGTILKNRKDT